MKGLFKLSSEVKLKDWTFNEIDIKDKGLYNHYIEECEYPAELWAQNFVNLWSYSKSSMRRTLWKLVDGMLVTFSHETTKDILSLMCLPFGKGDPKHVYAVTTKCMLFCHDYNKNTVEASKLLDATKIKTIDQRQVDWLKQIEDFEDMYKLKKSPYGVERHYSIDNLINLPGKDFEYIRRKVNKFKREYPQFILRDAVPSDYDNLIILFKKWQATAGEKYFRVTDAVAYKEIVRHHTDLDHIIMLVEIDKRIVGMISGGALPNGQSWCCLRKPMNDIDGLSEYLIVELGKRIRDEHPEIEILNDGGDGGQKGLIFFKDRFRPIHNLPTHSVHLR